MKDLNLELASTPEITTAHCVTNIHFNVLRGQGLNFAFLRDPACTA